MGQVPPGFTFPKTVDQFSSPHGAASAASLRNGNDFWWDEFASNRWNCWYANTGPDGKPGSITGPGNAGRTPGVPPNPLPDCANGTNRDASMGNGDVAKEQYLVDCSEGPDDETGPLDCDWWSTPPRPRSAAASAQRREFARAARRFRRDRRGAQAARACRGADRRIDRALMGRRIRARRGGPGRAPVAGTMAKPGLRRRRKWAPTARSR